MTELEIELRRIGDVFAGCINRLMQIGAYDDAHRYNLNHLYLIVMLSGLIGVRSQNLESAQVSYDEMVRSFRVFERMEICADDFNARYQLLLDILFGRDLGKVREKLQRLVDVRNERSVLVDICTCQTAPYDPSMYDEHGNYNRAWKSTLPKEEKRGWFRDMFK